MEKIKNRKNWLVVGAFVLLSFLILFSWNSFKVEAAGTPTTVVVNPGHGGINSSGKSDPGAVSNGYREVDLNNALAIKTVLTLRASGYNAMLSHPAPGSGSIPTLLATAPTMDNYSATISAAADKIGADLIIAIHHNSDGGFGGHGYEFYWSSYHPGIPDGKDGLYEVHGLWANPGDEPTIRDAVLCEAAEKSKELANSFNENFKSLDYITSRNKIIERDDAITKYPNMPSVLIEAGFISNSAEVKQLADGNNQQKMAEQILVSVNSIFGNGYTNEPMTASNVTSTVSGNQITATVTGINAPNGIKQIQFPVWSDVKGQDDLKWYTATAQTNESYSFTFDIKDHNYDAGNYNIHCYGTDNNDKLTMLGATSANVKMEQMSASGLTANAASSHITATIKGITAPGGIKSILVPIWSDINSQDDIKWYTAKLQTDESYSVTIDIKDHNNDTGSYNVHFYGIDNNDKLTMLGATTVTIDSDTMLADNFTTRSSGSQITATISGITAPQGVKQILVPAWSDINSQDDIKWYTAKLQTDRSYSVTIDIKDHNNVTGIYNVHCYGIDNNDKWTMLGESTVNVSMIGMKFGATASGDKITATITGVTAADGINQILVPTWSEDNGQDDLIWYPANLQSDGSYSVTIDVKDHNYDIGDYNVHCYGIDKNNKWTMVGATKVMITNDPMKVDNFEVTALGNKIIVKITGITAPRGLKMIQVPVWSEMNSQDDLIWYTAKRQTDESYTVTIDTKNHNNDIGEYNVHCYGVDNNDKLTMLGETTVNIEKITPIMGETTVSAQQLINYYESTGSTYPQKYNDLGVNLETFINMYIQEANAEGVRAEVAFAQAMLETGNLKFGGDVKVGQFNFAGLGATGGVPGFDFAAKYGDNRVGIQMGIRAHIQHLKCYGSNLPLNQVKVDPRWADSIRLKATTVEGLSGTWAADLNYAPKIINIMNRF
ncbi:MAG: GBS Bsp-like repeat-containing protein [Eubacteriaceae bacterium]|nr:GBS Bsp-like repeat-containing protein [Eubacteriaceae bacterium]